MAKSRQQTSWASAESWSDMQSTKHNIRHSHRNVLRCLILLLLYWDTSNRLYMTSIKHILHKQSTSRKYITALHTLYALKAD